jgi:chromosomal replication initiator protein
MPPPSPLTPVIWESVKGEIKTLFPDDVFQLWFEPVVFLSGTSDSITLGVPNDFVAIWIHDTYLSLITQRVSSQAGRDVSITLKKLPRHAACGGT